MNVFKVKEGHGIPKQTRSETFKWHFLQLKFASSVQQRGVLASGVINSA